MQFSVFILLISIVNKPFMNEWMNEWMCNRLSWLWTLNLYIIRIYWQHLTCLDPPNHQYVMARLAPRLLHGWVDWSILPMDIMQFAQTISQMTVLSAFLVTGHDCLLDLIGHIRNKIVLHNTLHAAIDFTFHTKSFCLFSKFSKFHKFRNHTMFVLIWTHISWWFQI